MIKIRNLSKNYGEVDVFSKVDVDLDISTPLCIKGESGSGKSTFCNIIAGLEQDYEGMVEIYGINKTSKVAIMPQSSMLINYMTVYENIECFSGADSSKIDSYLEELNISHLKHKLLSEISGGEKQRVNFIRCLVNEPDIVILDEPTANLDEINSQGIIEIVDKIAAKKVSVIIITHDKRVLNYYDNHCTIDDGKVIYNSEYDGNLSTQTKLVYSSFKVKSLSQSILKHSSKKFNFGTVLGGVFLSAVLIFTLLFSTNIISFHSFLDNFYGDNAGYIQREAYNSPDADESCKEILEYQMCATGYTQIPGYIGFTQEELDYIKAYEGIESVIPVYDTIANAYYSYTGGSIKNVERDSITYVLNVLPANLNELSNFGDALVEYFNTDFIYGSPTSLEQDDIVIPIRLAYELAPDDPSTLIDKTVDLELHEGASLPYTIRAIYETKGKSKSTDEELDYEVVYAGPLDDEWIVYN